MKKQFSSKTVGLQNIRLKREILHLRRMNALYLCKWEKWEERAHSLRNNTTQHK